MAVEVKNRNATVHVDGDDWSFDKYDRYGNLVESGRMVDHGGRSPSVQLHQPVDDLERFLASRNHPVAIQRAVLLTHERSRLGSLADPTVHVATTPDHLVKKLKGARSPSLDAQELAALEDLIRHDHDYHARRKR